MLLWDRFVQRPLFCFRWHQALLFWNLSDTEKTFFSSFLRNFVSQTSGLWERWVLSKDCRYVWPCMNYTNRQHNNTFQKEFGEKVCENLEVITLNDALLGWTSHLSSPASLHSSHFTILEFRLTLLLGRIHSKWNKIGS